MTRLETISKYITDNEKVLDVGCDQALLSRLLAKRGIYSIASDLRSNIIEKAKETTPKPFLSYIDFRVGNGVTLKDNENNFTLVLAGMGAYTMLDILKNTDKRFDKIITISNNNNDMLRKEMLKLKYKVSLEEIIKEKGKYYNLIVFLPGTTIYSEEETIVGVNHQNKGLLKEYNDYLIEKYSKITENKELVKVVEILKNYTY